MNLTQSFLLEMEGCKEYSEAVEIVQQHASGKVWLIGGFVYRTIAHLLYNTPVPEVDLDFIVEHEETDFNLPEGWVLQHNRYGNPKLVHGQKSIDYVPLQNIHSLGQQNLEPTIDNFLNVAPLTVQSIVHDTQKQEIVGETGIRALLDKTVGVHNQASAEHAAQKKGKTLQQYLQDTAESLAFGST